MRGKSVGQGGEIISFRDIRVFDLGYWLQAFFGAVENMDLDGVGTFGAGWLVRSWISTVRGLFGRLGRTWISMFLLSFGWRTFGIGTSDQKRSWI